MVSTIPMVSFLITLLLASAVSIQGVQINDTDGNPLTVNEQYYIQPVVGGGIYPVSAGNQNGIYQKVVNNPGVPVRFAFSWPFLPETLVNTYSDVTIEFETMKGCNGASTYWGVDITSTTDEPALIVGAERTRPNSWFQIRTAGDNIYELSSGNLDVGLFPTSPKEMGVRGQLKLTNDTAKSFFVEFKKVNIDATMATPAEKSRLRMFPFY